MELDRPTRIPALKTRLGFPTIHLEKRHGTQHQAIAYCQDTEKRVPGTMFFEHGTKSTSGKRTDLEDIKELCDAGTTIGEIAGTHFGSYIRYHRGIEKYNAIIQQKTHGVHPMEVIVYWGPTGTGKTWRAEEENPEHYKLPNPNGDNVFFDGYDGQKCMIIDDFYGWVPFNLMLRICDRYSCPGNTKGAMTMLKLEKVVITSNEPPRNWYKKVKDNLYAAFARRITKVVEMNKVWEGPPGELPPALTRTQREQPNQILERVNTPRPIQTYVPDGGAGVFPQPMSTSNGFHRRYPGHYKTPTPRVDEQIKYNIIDLDALENEEIDDEDAFK